MDSLALPAERLPVDGEEGETDFADLVGGGERLERGGEGRGGGGAYEAREGEFEEEEIGAALVAADFAEGYGAGFVAAGSAGCVFVFMEC